MNRLTIALITTLSCAAAHGSTDYVMTQLPLRTVNAINSSGVAVGELDDDNNYDSDAAAVVDGQLIVLKGREAGYTSLVATDISNAGHIVGYASSPLGTRALFWQSVDAAPREMGGHGGSNKATAVNSQGVAVGDRVAMGRTQAFRWSATTGTTLLEPPVGGYAYPRDISETGYVTGSIVPSGVQRALARWNPNGSSAVVASSGFGWQILDNGSIVGFGFTGQDYTPAVWSIANTVTALTSPSALRIIRMTSTGRLVGQTAPEGGYATTQESLHSPAVQLPTPGGAFSYATDANACGTIVGAARLATSGGYTAVMWRRPACDVQQFTTVPEVRGYQLDQAVTTLRQSSVFAGSSSFVNGYCSDLGHVVAQTPRSSTQVPRASFIDLTLVGNCAVTVPGLRGQTTNEAGATLQSTGLQLGQISSTPDRTCNYIGLIMTQSPAAGVSSVWGSRVNVTVGTRPKTACP